MHPTLKAATSLLKETFREWQEDKAQRLGAALAYYSIFAMGPVLLLTIAIAGLFFGGDAARREIVSTFSSLVGQQGAEALDTLIQAAADRTSGTIALVVGGAALLFGAVGVFVQLKDALNTVWDVRRKKPEGWKNKVKAFAKSYLAPFGMLLGMGFIALVALVVSAALSAASRYFSHLIPGSTILWAILHIVVSLGVVTLLFALIFRYLPDVKVAWHDVWIGALGTAVLFTVGQILLGLYLGRGSIGSAYGAAGSVVVLLVWVYYSAQILFFGAEFTQVYANRYGSRIRPDEDAYRYEEKRKPGEGRRPTG